MIIKNILKFIGVEWCIIKEEVVYFFNFKKIEYLNNYIVKGVLIRLNKFIEWEKIVFYKEKFDFLFLEFGKYFIDYMFVMDYEEGMGWYYLRIELYVLFMFDLFLFVFYYGQVVFEGLKVYRIEDGRVLLFWLD